MSLSGEHGACFTHRPVGPVALAALFCSEGFRGEPSVARLSDAALQQGRRGWTALGRAGIRPAFAAGQSAGELAAAATLGLVELPPARLAEVGARLDALVSPPGSPGAVVLLSVLGAAPVSVEAALHAAPGLYLCADDSPRHQLLCGAQARIHEASRLLGAGGALCRELPWPIAPHSPLFLPAADALGALFDASPVLRPAACLFSSASARPFPFEAPAATRRMLKDQWTRPVRFRETVEAPYAEGVRGFPELPGQQGLAGYATDTLGARPHLAATLGGGSPLALAHLAAQLWVHQMPVDLAPWRPPVE
ncbi:MAG: ACP S-malonyltransferase [Deltaproteobacteria bacterium]|nr:ACP S-malonyltransferase [Deltaproteobacteria bacterium]